MTYPIAKHTYTYERGKTQVYIVMESPGVGKRTITSFPKVGGWLLANEWAKQRNIKLVRS